MVTDVLGFTVTIDVQLEVAPKLAITIKAVSAPKALRAYRARLQATGGVGPRTWKIVGGKSSRRSRRS
jgi:hypothetical protein